MTPILPNLEAKLRQADADLHRAEKKLVLANGSGDDRQIERARAVVEERHTDVRRLERMIVELREKE